MGEVDNADCLEEDYRSKEGNEASIFHDFVLKS